MALKNSLKAKGWNISEDGLNDLLEENKSLTTDQIMTKALDVDLREYGAKCLPDDISRGKIESLDGNRVLQINNIKNISQPKSFEKDFTSSSSGSQFLKVQMTDGTVTCFGLCLSNIHNLRPDVPPGTKIYLKPGNITVKQGFVLLDSSVCNILGGKVQHMVDKWELSRNAAKSARSRSGGQDGNRPPPWVAFGHRINSNVNTKGKSLDATSVNAQGKENPEFDEQRKAIIAEAVKAKQETQKKVFTTSGVKQIESNHKVFNAVSGTTSQESSSHNNRDLSQGYKTEKNYVSTKQSQRSETAAYRNLDKNRDVEETQVSSRPSGPSTLFDFLNIKMSLDDEKSNASNHTETQNTYQNDRRTDQAQQHGRQNKSQEFNKQRSHNQQSNQRSYEDRQRMPETRKYDSRNKGSRNDGQSNFQQRRKGNSNYGSQNYRDNNSGHFDNAPPSHNYQQHYPSLDQHQELQQYGKTDVNKPTYKPRGNVPAATTDRILYDHSTSTWNNSDDVNNRHNMSRAQNAADGMQRNFTHNNRERPNFREGDKVMAKYWEDNKFHPAVVHATSNGQTIVVQFMHFMNYEEILISDIYRPNVEQFGSQAADGARGPDVFTGKNLEFRRGGGGRQYSDTKSFPNDSRNPKKGMKQQNLHTNTRAAGSRPLYVPPAQRTNNS